MNWFHDLTDELPAPRDDEPSSLRQDIADELADHLHSSFVRELHRTPEESSAKQHVLDRFGDPRRVARKLWFDAMKEKILSQRVNLVLSSLMTVACLGALGLMTFMLRDSREVNAAILERLQAIALPQPAPAPVIVPAQPAAESAKSMDWVRPKFKLVLGEKGGPSAVGYRVQLQAGQGGVVLGETEKNGMIYPGMVEETTGADGIVDLGLFRFGNYTLIVTTPWGEMTQRQLGLRPGQEPIREIACPPAPPEKGDVAFSVEWPDDLKEKNLWLICDFGSGTRRIGFDSWRTQSISTNAGDIGGFGLDQGHLIIDSRGQIAIRSMALTQRQNEGTEQITEIINMATPSRFGEQLSLPALRLQIITFRIIEAIGESEPRGVPVLARGGSAMGNIGMGGMGGMGGGMGGGGMGGGFFNVQSTGRQTGEQDPYSYLFQPKAGQLNHWTIKITEQVLDQVRVKLKLKPDPAAAADPTAGPVN